MHPQAPSGSLGDAVEAIVEAVSCLRESILSLVGRANITDVCFIGSQSPIYDWVPSRIVDFDALVFAEALDTGVGNELFRLRSRIGDRLHALGLDFELRVIRGAYKPQRLAPDRPIVLAHLGVFDEQAYLQEPATKRWAWKKYRCEREPERLVRLAPSKPSASDLLLGPYGVRDKLRDLHAGVTSMVEWILPDLGTVVHEFDANSPVFCEFCNGAAATTARHHARLLDHPEADFLSNAEFFRWYDENVLKSASLVALMRIKAETRNQGFSDIDRSRMLAIDYLSAARSALRALR